MEYIEHNFSGISGTDGTIPLIPPFIVHSIAHALMDKSCQFSDNRGNIVRQ